jgi:hypothetical protein
MQRETALHRFPMCGSSLRFESTISFAEHGKCARARNLCRLYLSLILTREEQAMYEPQWISFAERRRALLEQQRLTQQRVRSKISRYGVFFVLLAVLLFIAQQSHMIHLGLGFPLKYAGGLVELLILALGLFLLLAIVVSRAQRIRVDAVPKAVHPNCYTEEPLS